MEIKGIISPPQLSRSSSDRRKSNTDSRAKEGLMGVRRPREERYFPRYHNVTGAFPGRLVEYGTEKEVAAKVIDVSRDGVGVLTEAPVTPGQVLHLVIDDKKVALAIV